MHESIDWPHKTDSPRPRRRGLIFLLVAFLVILFSARTAISYWVDLLWFRSLGYADVFWKTRELQWGIFAAFATATFVIIFGVFLLLKRAHAEGMPSTHTIFVAGNPVNLPVEFALRLAAVVGSLLLSLATAAAMQAQWSTLALYWYAPRGGGECFRSHLRSAARFLPLHIACLAPDRRLASHIIRSQLHSCRRVHSHHWREPRVGGRLSGGLPLPWRGVSIAFGVFLFVLALHVYIGRFDLLYQHHTIFDGVTYTDAHVTLTGLLIVSWALALRGDNRHCRRHHQAGWALAGCCDCSRSHLLHRGCAGGLVCDQLHRQAQRARARRAFHRS